MVKSRAPRALDIWMNGELVGVWFASRAGVPVFEYSSEWLRSPRARPLSISLPILPDNQPHRGAHVDAWFDNLLPESREVRERIGRRYQTRSLQAFELLGAIGRDCVGAVQIVPSGESPGDVRRIDAVRREESNVAQLLRSIAAPGTSPGAETGPDFRISIAGAQEKTALLWRDGAWYTPTGATATTHILKLPLGVIGPVRADMSDSAENEWVCLQILRELGFDVPHVWLEEFRDDVGTMKVLVVTRFDREIVRSGTDGATEWIVRLPQEDFCQASGTPPHLKYESDGGPGVSRILPLLLAGGAPARDALTFAKAQLAFWLLAAPDGHAKNFSIFLQRSGYRLTPMYDVVSAWPIIGTGAGEWAYRNVRLAMAIRGQRPHRHLGQLTVRHWQSLAAHTGQPDAFAHMRDMVENAEHALSEVQTALPHDFPAVLWDRISSGVRRHRSEFLAALPAPDAGNA